MDTLAQGQMKIAPGYDHPLVPMFLENGPERLDVVLR
jgi:hypothetical protein